MRAAVLAMLLVPGAGVAAEPHTRVTAAAAIDLSEGRYGEERSTAIADSSITATVRHGGWAASISAHHVLIDGPADLVALDGTSVPRERKSRQRTGGIGDTVLTLTREVFSSDTSGLYGTAVGKLRLPTGSEVKGTGVGALDAMAGGEVGWSVDLGGASARLIRRFLGDHDYRRRDGWQAEGAIWINPSPSLQIGADYEHRQSAFAHQPPSRTAEVTVAWRLRRGLWLSLAGSRGFSRTAAHHGITAGASVRL